MPVDLDELFTALGAHADRVPVGGAEQARRRARRRRHRRAVAAVAVLVLSVTGAAAITQLASRPVPPAAPTPKPTVTFVPLQPAGSLPMELSDAGQSGSFRNWVTIIDEVAYVLGGPRPGIPTRLGALDLTTGRPLFPTVDLGLSFGTPQLAASRWGLVVMVPSQPDGTSTLFVVDPATGVVRWRLDDEFSTVYNAVHAESALVIWDPSGGPLRGLDWQTGAELWRGPSVRAGGGVYFVLPADFALPATAGWPAIATDRLVVEGEDRQVHVVDLSTGETVQRIDIGFRQVHAVLGDTLYAGVGGDVWAYPVDRPGEATLIYTDEPGRPVNLYPCGSSVRCLSTNSDAGVRTIVLDPVTHQTLWESTEYVRQAVGDRLLDREGLLYDLSGRRLGDPVTHDVTWWLTPGSLLTLDMERGFTTAAVGGMYAEDGDTIRLGEIPTPLGRGYGCAVDQQYLVCPTADGFQAWRFATE